MTQRLFDWSTFVDYPLFIHLSRTKFGTKFEKLVDNPRKLKLDLGNQVKQRSDKGEEIYGTIGLSGRNWNGPDSANRDG
jgi:hypothetical protein